MPAKKIRVELLDSDGNRYTIAFEGQITRDKAVRLLDLVELLGGMASNSGDAGANISVPENQHSKYDKVQMIVQRSFPLIWFSSRDLQKIYEQEYKEPISLSTVATYLSRFASKGIVMKSGASNSLKYKLATNLPQAQLKQLSKQAEAPLQ
jgi:hypothetical protein